MTSWRQSHPSFPAPQRHGTVYGPRVRNGRVMRGAEGDPYGALAEELGKDTRQVGERGADGRARWPRAHEEGGPGCAEAHGTAGGGDVSGSPPLTQPLTPLPLPPPRPRSCSPSPPPRCWTRAPRSAWPYSPPPTDPRAWPGCWRPWSLTCRWGRQLWLRTRVCVCVVWWPCATAALRARVRLGLGGCRERGGGRRAAGPGHQACARLPPSGRRGGPCDVWLCTAMSKAKGKGQRASVGDPQPDDPFGQLARLQKEVPLPMRWSCWDSNPDLRLYRPLFYR
jgi:hypothetical protein